MIKLENHIHAIPKEIPAHKMEISNKGKDIISLFLGLKNIETEDNIGIGEVLETIITRFNAHYESLKYSLKKNKKGEAYIEMKNHHGEIICTISNGAKAEDIGYTNINFNINEVHLLSRDFSWKGSLSNFLLHYELDDHNNSYVPERVLTKNIFHGDIVDMVDITNHNKYDPETHKFLRDKNGIPFRYIDHKNGKITIIMKEGCQIRYNNNLRTDAIVIKPNDDMAYIKGYEKYEGSMKECKKYYIDIHRGDDEMVYSTKNDDSYTNIFGDIVYANSIKDKDIDGDYQDNELTPEDLDACQKKVILQLHLGHNVFISGRAGTGKSAVIKMLENIFPEKIIEKTASTGFAALNIGGRTTSSTMRLKIFESDDLEIWEKNKDNESIKYADIIVIDESLIYNRENIRQIDLALKSANNNNKLFGGKQMVFLGDIAQLEPFEGKNPIGSDFFRDFVTIELQTIHRQESPVFQNILESYRNHVLKTGEPILPENWLRYTSREREPGMILTASIQRANKINELFINELEGKPIEFTPEISGKYSKELPYKKIKYYVGMQVMCIRNGKYGYTRLVNGDIGIIESIDDSEIKVYFPEKKESAWINKVGDEEYETYEIPIQEALERELEQYRYNRREEHEDNIFEDEDGNEVEMENDFIKNINDKLVHLQNRQGKVKIKKIIGGAYFFPLIPSYAVTVRKAQGLTLSQGVLDVSVLKSKNSRIRYVGVSRFEKLEKVFVTDVVKYMKKKERKSYDDASILFEKDHSAEMATHIYMSLHHYKKEDRPKIAELLLESDYLSDTDKQDLINRYQTSTIVKSENLYS